MPSSLDTAAEAAEKLSLALKQAAKDAEGLNSAFKDQSSSSTLARLGSSLSNLKSTASGMLGVARDLAHGFDDIARAAAEADRRARAVAALGPAYDRVAASTRGAFTASQILASQQSLVQAGLHLTDQQLANVAQKAREVANATGGDATQALQQLTDALRTGSAEQLAKFGIHAKNGADKITVFGQSIEQITTSLRGHTPVARTATEEYDQMHRALTDVGDAMNGTASSLTGGSSAVAYMTEAFQGMALAIRAGTTALANMRGELVALASSGGGHAVGSGASSLAGSSPTGPSETFNTHGGITPSGSTRAGGPAKHPQGHGGGGGGGGPRYDAAVFQEIQGRVEDLIDLARGSGVAVDRLVQQQGERLDAFVAREGQALTAAFGGTVDAVVRHRGENVEGFVGRQMAAVQHAADERLRTIHAIDDATIREAREAAERLAAEQQRLDAKTMERAQRNAQRFQGFQGALQHTTQPGDQGTLDSYRTGFQRGQIRPEDVDAQIRGLQTSAQSASVGDQEAAALQHKAEILGQARDAWLEYAAAQAKANDVTAQFGEAFSEFFDLTKTAAQSAAGLATGALNVLGGALEQTIGALLDGEQITAQSLGRLAHEVTKKVALMALAEGTLELGRGVGKIAASYGTDPTAYGHLAAAGIDLGMAAAFGLAAYATRDVGKGGAGAGGGWQQHAANDQRERSQGSGGGTVIQVSFDGRAVYDTRERVHDSIVDGIREAARRGNIPPVSRESAWVA